MNWPPKHVELLEQLWNAGKTASKCRDAINQAFGTDYSRNSICGAVNRRGLKSRGSPIKSKDPTATADKRKAASQGPRHRQDGARAVVEARKRSAEASVNAKPTVNVKSSPLVVLRTASPFRQCQFPLTDRAPWKFCGKPTVPGHSWCHACCNVVYKPREETAKDKAA
jgi:GcrA cell cycle regulator